MPSILSILWSPFKTIRGWLAGWSCKATDAAAAAAIERFRDSFTVMVPAVAGFVYRLPPPPVNFHLPARLASVARLNTPVGRVPYVRQARVSATVKAKPVSAAADRKRSQPIAPQPRRSAIKRPADHTNVVAIAQAKSRCVPLEIRVRHAA